MAHVNENYLKLPGNYLFATIAKKLKLIPKHIRKRISSASALAT